jgi:hypothetical protein
VKTTGAIDAAMNLKFTVSFIELLKVASLPQSKESCDLSMKCALPTNTAMYHGYDCSVLPRIREIQTAYPWNASC